MRKIITLLMSLMLVGSVASAKISADISNRRLKQISRTSIQDIQVLPDTKADIFLFLRQLLILV